MNSYPMYEAYAVLVFGAILIACLTKIVTECFKHKEANINAYLLWGVSLTIAGFIYPDLMSWVLSGFDFSIYHGYDGEITYETYHLLVNSGGYLIRLAGCALLLIGIRLMLVHNRGADKL